MLMGINEFKIFRTQAYIDGVFVDASSKQTFQVINPADGTVVADVTDCGTEEVLGAINAANNAFPLWSGRSAIDRSIILKRWNELVLEHLDTLAQILTIEQGKPLSESRGEIKYGASFIEWFAEESKRVYGDTIPGHLSDKRILVIKQPIGVVAAITPWNFPIAMITRKVAPAIAVGCTVVIKPSELTPLSALALAELANQAGIPKGVFNVITTENADQTGKIFSNSPIVKKISFTGSTEVGKHLIRQSAATVKKVSMELGGNAPFIVFDDADIENASTAALLAKFRNAGQTCVCANRIFVQDSVFDSFSKLFVQKVKQLEVGNGLDKNVDIGPLINQEAVEFIDDLVRDALQKGADEILRGGLDSDRTKTLFYKPIVLTDVSVSSKIFGSEIFGPVAPIFRFKTEDEVINLANDTSYGLASYFFGKDHARIWRVAEGLDYGMIGINTGMISTTVAPFGGIKESGIGKEGSKYGIDEFVVVKYLCWSL